MTAGAFVLLAAAGALLRFAARYLHGAQLPIGTLVVNLAGSFALGLIAGWSPPAATVAGTAGLGALTTFSSFADEVVAMWGVDRRHALAYVAASLGGGVALAWVGLHL